MSGSSASRRYPPELKERAVRMVVEIRDDHESEWAAMAQVAELLGVGSFDRFADLDQADADGVVDQPVGQATPCQAVVDGVQGGLDVVESLPVAAAHSGTA
jgi:hypothetical protein